MLKHQSTLLLADIVKDEKMMHLVQEVEVLKRTLEEDQQRHMTEIQELQVQFWRLHQMVRVSNHMLRATPICLGGKKL